jgi:hypothetical protein
MSQVRTFFLLLWRDLCWRLTGRYGIAPHRVLESRRRENESQTNGFRASVLQTYPRVLGNKDYSPGMNIAFLIAEPNMGLSALDQQNLILYQVPVFRYCGSRCQFFRARHEMLGIVLGLTFSMN